MSKRICLLEMVFLLLLAGVLAWGTALEQSQQRLAAGMLRLHVVGASNRDYDQMVKLQVRDAVLATAEPYLEGASTAKEAHNILQQKLPELEQAANQTLSVYSSDIAQVTLGRDLFGTRHYDGFSLPGGYYDALKVTIGPGQGKNWWCVVYPQICSASTMEQQEAVAVMGGLTEEDVALIQGETNVYRFKFKTLELFENLMVWIRAMEKGIPASE